MKEIKFKKRLESASCDMLKFGYESLVNKFTKQGGGTLGDN
jgi:hypothetical protein